MGTPGVRAGGGLESCADAIAAERKDTGRSFRSMEHPPETVNRGDPLHNGMRAVE
jgi:hypothetical protein